MEDSSTFAVKMRFEKSAISMMAVPALLSVPATVISPTFLLILMSVPVMGDSMVVYERSSLALVMLASVDSSWKPMTLMLRISASRASFAVLSLDLLSWYCWVAVSNVAWLMSPVSLSFNWRLRLVSERARVL